LVEERENEINGIKTKNTTKKNKEEIRGRFQRILTRGGLKTLKKDIRGLFMSSS